MRARYEKNGSGYSLKAKYANIRYQQLEYIESTGTQYVDIDYICKTTNIKMELDLMWTGTNVGAFETFIGFMYSTSQVTPRIGLHKYSSNLMFGANNTVLANPTQTPVRNERFTYYGDFTSGNAKLYKNNNLIATTTSTYTFSTNTCPTYVFARYCPNSMNYAKMRLYSCKIWEGTTLVKDIIPVKRISDSALGLYDKLSDSFYQNGGTGTFVASTNVIGSIADIKEMRPVTTLLPSAYQEVEYIQSDGGQAIDTGIKLDMDNAKIEIDFQATTTSQTGMILASSSGNYWWLYHYSQNIHCYLDGTSGSQQNLRGPVRDTNKHKAIYQNKTYYVDNIQYGTATGNLGLTSGNLFMFKWSATDTTYTYKGKIYNCKIWNDGIHLTRHFVPCYRKSDNVIGLYDIVNHNFYYNLGSGTFNKGSNINTII